MLRLYPFLSLLFTMIRLTWPISMKYTAHGYGYVDHQQKKGARVKLWPPFYFSLSVHHITLNHARCVIDIGLGADVMRSVGGVRRIVEVGGGWQCYVAFSG
jgi:hypothetical protein